MTKKAKIITIFLSVFAAIVLLVVLSSTLFAVSEVKVSFQGEKHKLASIDEKEIAKTADIKNGTHVFLVDKKKAINNIEKKYPYIKVLNIEIKFPNKVVVNAVEREEVFVFQQSERHLFVDSDFKVLRIVTGNFDSTISDPIKVMFEECDAKEGEFLKASQKFLTLKSLEQSNYENFSKEESNTALSMLLTRYKSIDVFDEKLEMQTFQGVKIVMYTPNYKQQEKLEMATLKINELSATDRTKGTIYISQKDGYVVASYENDE